MTSIFISYDRDDRPLTRQLATQLRRVYGFDQVWYDENIRGGEDWWDEIRKQIADRDILCSCFRTTRPNRHTARPSTPKPNGSTKKSFQYASWLSRKSRI